MNNGQSIGVIFDMDGVLVDSGDAHFESWKALAHEIGREFSEQDFALSFGRQNQDIIPMILGINDPNEVTRLADRKEQIYRDLVRADPPIVEGAVELVRSLHEHGVKLSVGSSAPAANVHLIVDAMDLRDVFDALVTGDEVTRGKPDPEVFQTCAAKIGCAPQNCVVVEDAPAGIEAAVRAGCCAVAVLIHHEACAFHGATETVHALSELTSDSLMALAAKGGMTA